MITLLVIIFLIFPQVQSKYKILAILPHPEKSYFIAYEPLLKELSNRGHQVTVISNFPQDGSIPNYHDISLAGKVAEHEDKNFASEPSYLKLIGFSIDLIRTGTDNCKVLLSNENVQRLWQTEAKYDVILVEQFNSDCALAVAYKLRAPVVGITSHALMPHHLSTLGIPNNPSYTPFPLLDGGVKPKLQHRTERAFFIIYFQYFIRVISQTMDQYTLSKYFNRIPPLEELKKRTKFLLINEYFTLFEPTILPTNVKQIGGFHIPDNKQLPDNLENFINGSKKGVIYINLGNIVKNTSISPEKLDNILGAVSKLRQRVIWKWEEDFLPNNPKDVLIQKWLPQNDLLAHKKVKAFFSHCGLLGITEAIYHGVPVICMPMSNDQPRNAKAVEESGLGVQIQVSELNNDTLLEKFTTILDTKFRKKVKLLSKMWRFRPKSPKEEAIYWIEYGARFPNATFRSVNADVPVYQYLCFDVIIVFLIIIGSIIYLLLYCIKTYKSRFDDKQKIKKSKWKRP